MAKNASCLSSLRLHAAVCGIGWSTKGNGKWFTKSNGGKGGAKMSQNESYGVKMGQNKSYGVKIAHNKQYGVKMAP